METAGGSSKHRCNSYESTAAPETKHKRQRSRRQDANETPQYIQQADAYKERGQWDKAVKLQLRTIHSHEQWLGDDHQETLNSRKRLADTYTRLLMFDLATPLQEQVLSGLKRKYGENHPDTVEGKHALACTYVKQYRLDAAKQLALEVLSARKHIYGQEHPKTQEATEILAVIRYKQGQMKRACKGHQSAGSISSLTHSEVMQGTSRPTAIYVEQSQLDTDIMLVLSTGIARIAQRAMSETSTTVSTQAQADVIQTSGQKSPNRQHEVSNTTSANSGFEDWFIQKGQPSIRSTSISFCQSKQDGFRFLVHHHCLDLTDQLDLAGCSTVPVAGSRFNDIWLGKLIGRADLFAIKCVRLHVQSSNPANSKHIKRAIREAYIGTLVANTKHPNIMALTGVALFQDQLALISPWMSNGTLLAYIFKHPDVDRWQLCQQVTEGLVCIHGLGMVHGDLKAANVFVSDVGIAKIGDFGNAFVSSGSSDFTATSNVGGGTSRWMARELLLSSGGNDEEVSDRSMPADVFALGMTVLEVTTGRKPYSEFDSDPYVTLLIIRGVAPQRPSELASITRFGNERWAVMNECWRINPEDRPTATKIRDRISTLV